MKWSVQFTDVALKTLKKMDLQTASMILGYIEKRLTGEIDPRSFGKPLVGNQKDKWRYRIGDYRLLCRIEDESVVILVIQVGHRNDIYR